MKLETDERTDEMCYKIANKSKNINVSFIKEVFRNFFIQMLIDTLEGKSTYIPYIGELNIEFDYDKEKGDYKEAELTSYINFDMLMKRIFGQIEDGDTTEIEEFLIKEISRNTAKKLQE